MGSKRKIRIGIIGAGGICQVAHLPNIVQEGSAIASALCDSDTGRAASVAERFEIPKWYSEPEEMLRLEKLDAVLIATPTITHLPLCQIALEYGLDVFVEKPFARNVQEARRIVEIAEKNKHILMVGMNHRFRDDTQRMKSILECGDLGEILTVRSAWLRRLGVWGRPYWFTDPDLAGGGVLMDLGLQMIDLVLYLLDFPNALDVVCSTSHKILELEVEDTASCFVRFDNNATFNLEVSWANCDREDIAYNTITGSHGIAQLNPLRVTRRQRNRIMEITPHGLADEVVLYRTSFQAEILHFIDSVRNGTTPSSSGREAIASIELAERLYKSSGI